MNTSPFEQQYSKTSRFTQTGAKPDLVLVFGVLTDEQ